MLLSWNNLFISQNEEGDLSLSLLSTILLLLLIVISLYLAQRSDKKKQNYIKTNQLVFASASIALATVLSFIKPISLPYGGSMTMFSMFFITFIGSLYGAKLGLVTGVAYGFLQLILGPSIVHPVQILLDYPIAFGVLGLSGLFFTKDTVDMNQKSKFYPNLIIGYLVGVVGRYLIHSLSGYIFFKEYVPVGDNAIAYTLTYNITYIAPEAILTIIILLLPPIKHVVYQLKKISTNS